LFSGSQGEVKQLLLHLSLAPGLKASCNKMKHGWAVGHNLRLDFRFGLGDPDRLRKCATELAASWPMTQGAMRAN
jgi:hypothetical protein